MWYNERIGAQEWFYVLPQGADKREIPGYEIVNFPGGLFTERPVPLFTTLLSAKCKAAYQGHKKRKDNLV